MADFTPDTSVTTPDDDTPAQQTGADNPTPQGKAAPDAPPPGGWPDDWRQQYAGEDKKKLQRLERYTSPKAALDALFSAQAKIASGDLKAPLAPDATPEEKAAWRAENGIPDDPNKYDLTLPNGMVIGENDKVLVDDFLKIAHEGNWKQDDVKRALGWFFSKQEEAKAQQQEADMQRRLSTEDELRAEFGGDYRRNIKVALSLLESAPEGIKDNMLGGRLADGTLIGDNPAVIKWLAALGREVNPISTVVPGSGTNAVQAVETELAGLRKLMGDHKSEYWRGANAEKLQARYRDLTSAISKGR